jgi:hypothetical protein
MNCDGSKVGIFRPPRPPPPPRLPPNERPALLPPRCEKFRGDDPPLRLPPREELLRAVDELDE